MRFPIIGSRDDLAALTEQLGFLPFFESGVPGWSAAENTDPALWFTGQEGPWEWKGQLAAARRCVYGKFYRGKAAFVSLECFPHLANYRRDGYDFEGRCDDGLVPHSDRLVMACLTAREPCRARDLRRLCGVRKGFDTSLTRLQMQTFVLNQDFVYDLDRQGRPYGWGNALLSTPERWLGEDVVNAATLSPAASLTWLVHRLCCAMPDVDEMTFRKLLK